MKLNYKWVALGALAAVAAFAPAASAQSSGTVAISGSVARAVKLTSGGAATLTGNSGGGVTTSSAADAALASVVDMGDVGPANPSAVVCFTQPLFLRANGSSTLSAAVTASSFTVGAGNIAKTNIGIGFTNLAAGGAQASIATSTVQASYGTDPCGGAFGQTLNDLATATPGTAVLVSTAAISQGGSFSAASNRALLDMRLGIVPGAYAAPDTFSATVTLTLTSP
jgi:hypothetical protein